MVQIVLTSNSLFVNSEATTTPAIIEDGLGVLTVPYNYYYQVFGKAAFTLNSLTIQKHHKKMYLKSFRGTYLQMTTEKYYNNNLILHNVTDNITTKFVFESKYFADVTSYVTYLNTACAGFLNFAWNDPSITPENYNQAVDKCVINHVDPTKSWYIEFNKQSINRSLGFDLGKTPVVPAGHKLISNTPFTTTSIGRIYLSLQIGTTSYTNASVPLTYLVYVQGDNLANSPAQGISFNANRDFDQQIDVAGTQYNQIVTTLSDEYGNIIMLWGHYSMVLNIE